MVVDLPAGRKVLSNKERLYDRRIRYREEMEAGQRNRHDRRPYGFTMLEDQTCEQEAGRWLYSSRRRNIWWWPVAYVVRPRLGYCWKGHGQGWRR